VLGGIAERRKRSEARRAAGSRITSIVPEKPGNSSREDPVEGSGVSDRGTVGGKHGGTVEFRDCVYETSADSGAGEGQPRIIFGAFSTAGCVTEYVHRGQRNLDLKSRMR
jgi:hypothetical protein